MTERSEKVEGVAKEEQQDCMECRLTGGFTLAGISVYANHLRMTSQVRRVRTFYGAISVGKCHCKCFISLPFLIVLKGTFGLALFRLFGP